MTSKRHTKDNGGYMKEIIKYEFECFKKDIESGSFQYGKYLDESFYENEYCKNDIYDAMSILANMIRNYLKENNPLQYIVGTSWCVLVMTPERAMQSRVAESTIKKCLV